jgi:UDP-2,3-diacylglucosamine pyrophosphatase LpxH
MTARQVYEEFYTKVVTDPCGYQAFRTQLKRWVKRNYPDDTTLECGTYDGFTAHSATVQVNKTGEIVQAWIKQTINDVDLDDIVKGLKESVEPFEYKHKADPHAERMLELPLFDMHWGVAFLDDYKSTLTAVLKLMHTRTWDKIVIPFGQDFFHNDSIVNGQTTKGTVIEKVDMVRAVKEAKTFIYALIDTAIHQANEVQVMYSAGNHDRSLSWLFIQVLLERYGAEVVDDSLEYRKVIVYGKNAIMVTHGDSKQATSKNLAHIFPIAFAEEFANASVREVHAGHLHHESEADIFGVMVRRLASGVKVDDWSNRQDFIGTHRRFMAFEWDRDSLRSIHYI